MNVSFLFLFLNTSSVFPPTFSFSCLISAFLCHLCHFLLFILFSAVTYPPPLVFLQTGFYAPTGIIAGYRANTFYLDQRKSLSQRAGHLAAGYVIKPCRGFYVATALRQTDLLFICLKILFVTVFLTLMIQFATMYINLLSLLYTF